MLIMSTTNQFKEYLSKNKTRNHRKKRDTRVTFREKNKVQPAGLTEELTPLTELHPP